MNHRPSHYLQYHAIVAVSALLRLLPRTWRSAVGAALGQLIYFIGIRRRVTQQNLAAAYPSLPPCAVRIVAARVYRHFGRVAVSLGDLAALKPTDVGRWILFEGLDTLREALAEGKGGIVVSGHLGNWELMGASTAKCGLPVTFVVTTQSNRLVEELMDRYRQAAGIEIVKRRDAIRGVLSALKRNRLVAILIDQDAHEDGAFVPFFGRPASTPRGPAVFHLRSGAPIIFAHCVRLPNDRYRIRCTRIDTAGETDADQLTARLTAILEAAIRETPEQWFWMHRRWKTRPSES